MQQSSKHSPKKKRKRKKYLSHDEFELLGMNTSDDEASSFVLCKADGLPEGRLFCTNRLSKATINSQ